MSSVLVKLQRKGQMVIPRSLREEVGISEGTLMKVAVVKGNQFLLTPQFSVDRSIVTVKREGESKKEVFLELGRAVSELRQEAKSKGLDTMSMKEINRAVASVRRDMKKTNNQSAK